MKNGITVILFFLLWLNLPVYGAIYDFKNYDYENNFSDFCKNKNKEINTEKEIEHFLKQKQIPISLDECLDIALKFNFNIKSNYENYKSYEYKYKNSLAKFLPDFGYTWYSIYYRGQVLVGTALVDQFNELALSSTLFVTHQLTEGGKQIFEAKAKKFEKFEKQENLNFTKEEILFLTTKYYWELFQTKADIEIYLKNLYERMAQLKLTQNQEESGVGTRFDVIRQENEVISAKRSMLNAINDFKLKQAKLSNIMGIEINTALFPIEETAKPYQLFEDIELEKIYDIAKKNRKDIKAYENKINSIKNEKRTLYTDFSLKPRIFYQHQNQGTARIGMGENNVVGLYVDWSLGENLGVGTITKIKAKTHEINSKIYELEIKIRNIKEKLLNSYYNSKLLLKKINITQKQIDFATESVSLAELRLEAGEGILIDVIQAQNQKLIAKIEHLHAIIEYNINQAELLFDTGTINIEKIIKNYNP